MTTVLERDMTERQEWKKIVVVAKDCIVENKRLPEEGSYRKHAIEAACSAVEQHLAALRSIYRPEF